MGNISNSFKSQNTKRGVLRYRLHDLRNFGVGISKTKAIRYETRFRCTVLGPENKFYVASIRGLTICRLVLPTKTNKKIGRYVLLLE